MVRTARQPAQYSKSKRAEEVAVFQRLLSICKFLYDEGPHTLIDLSKQFGLSNTRMAELLSLMVNEGTVEKYKHGAHFYWKIADHVEMAE